MDHSKDSDHHETRLNAEPEAHACCRENGPTESEGAKALAEIAAFTCDEARALIESLDRVIRDFKDFVDDSPLSLDIEIAARLGRLLESVETICSKMEEVSAQAMAMSLVSLASVSQKLREDIRAMVAPESLQGTQDEA